ncbi:hypothetical protein [Burkholderia cepacia]|uniref:hypothetical protein n=1 Tax=Burkholderia cepacia TaxID=292 RepID=UPI001E2E51F0|nr:hypothetical protein [Burkholderia cepacia]
MPATRAQQWLSTLIASNGQQAGSVKPPLHGVDINVLVKVIRTLCQYTDPTRPGLPRGAALPKVITDAVEFLSPLEALLTDWPTGFRNHVEQRTAAGRMNTLLGDWYISLRKCARARRSSPSCRSSSMSLPRSPIASWAWIRPKQWPRMRLDTCARQMPRRPDAYA